MPALIVKVGVREGIGANDGGGGMETVRTERLASLTNGRRPRKTAQDEQLLAFLRPDALPFGRVSNEVFFCGSGICGGFVDVGGRM